MIEQSKHYELAIICGAKRGPKDTDLTFSPASLRDFLKALEPQRQPLTDEQKDAARYRWLRDNSASFTWIPSRYNENTVSGFSAFGTGYLGFGFEAAVDLAIEAAHGIKE